MQKRLQEGEGRQPLGSEQKEIDSLLGCQARLQSHPDSDFRFLTSRVTKKMHFCPLLSWWKSVLEVRGSRGSISLQKLGLSPSGSSCCLGTWPEYKVRRTGRCRHTQWGLTGGQHQLSFRDPYSLHLYTPYQGLPVCLSPYAYPESRLHALCA